MQRDLLLLGEMIEAAERASQLTDGVTVEELQADRLRNESLLWNFTVLGEAAEARGVGRRSKPFRRVRGNLRAPQGRRMMRRAAGGSSRPGLPRSPHGREWARDRAGLLQPAAGRTTVTSVAAKSSPVHSTG